MTSLLNRAFPRRKPGIAKTLARCWLLQGVTWYGLTEIALRVALEGGVVAFMWSREAGGLAILLGWTLFHTGAWIVLYGGSFMIWKFLGFRTDLTRLRDHIDRIERRFREGGVFRLVVLRGSAARGELHEGSDIDFLFVPGPSLLSKVLGILCLWGLRAEAVLRRVPLEARWLDSGTYVGYHMRNEHRRVVRGSGEPSLPERMASRGIVVSFSGIDGSGKTTMANRLVSTLRGMGIDAVYFWGHWQAWYKTEMGPDIGLGDLYRSIWNRLGRRVEDFGFHPRAKLIYDALTSIDFLYIRWSLAILLRPGRIIVTDRYVADILAYMRSNGPVREPVEGLLLGLSVPPDLAFLFEITPEVALTRKRERPLRQLRRFVSAYDDLKTPLGLVPVDAGLGPDEVFADVLRTVRSRLAGPRSQATGPEVEPGAMAGVATGGRS